MASPNSDGVTGADGMQRTEASNASEETRESDVKREHDVKQGASSDAATGLAVTTCPRRIPKKPGVDRQLRMFCGTNKHGSLRVLVPLEVVLGLFECADFELHCRDLGVAVKFAECRDLPMVGFHLCNDRKPARVSFVDINPTMLVMKGIEEEWVNHERVCERLLFNTVGPPQGTQLQGDERREARMRQFEMEMVTWATKLKKQKEAEFSKWVQPTDFPWEVHECKDMPVVIWLRRPQKGR